jgi:hypothetical protein
VQGGTGLDEAGIRGDGVGGAGRGEAREGRVICVYVFNYSVAFICICVYTNVLFTVIMCNEIESVDGGR